MNRKNQVLATSLSLLLSVGMSGGTILPAYAMENAENTEVQTDVATNGNAEQSENGAQSQKETTPDTKEKTSNQAAAKSSSLPDSSKSVKEYSEGEEEGEEDTASKGIAVDAKHFPDEGFRKYVSAWFDLDQDGYLSDEEIEKSTRVRVDYLSEGEECPPLYKDSKNEYWNLLYSIKNVQGIEYLSNLKTLRINFDMSCKDMADLDLSHNVNLESLRVGVFASEGDDDEGLTHNTSLKSIDVSNCSKLETINITKCDNVKSLTLKQNDALTQLKTYESKIGNIDVTQCPNLEEFRLISDNIKDIDFTKCTKLQDLYLWCNNLTSIDLTKCTQLTNLELDCEKIKSVDLKQNAELEELDVSGSGLSSLDISGNRKLRKFINYYGCYYGDEDDQEKPAPITTLDFSNTPDLEEINVIGSPLENLNISKNEKLTDLNVGETNINKLDISKNINLDGLIASKTKITSIDISKNSKLRLLDVSETGIKTLDVSNLSELYILDVSGTAIQTLDVSKNSSLGDLNVSDTKITALDVSKNPELAYFDASKTKIKTLDISRNKKLYNLDLSNTSIDNMKNVDFSEYTNLSDLALDNAGIESITFDENQGLSSLSIQGNHVREMKVKNGIPSFPEKAKFNADNQTPTIMLEPDQIKNNTVALSNLFSDVSRVTIEKGEGYTYDADAKTITFQDKKNRKFKYTWDTKFFKNGSALLKGTATILVPNEPEEKPDSKPEEKPNPKPEEKPDPKPEVKYDTLTKIKLGTTRYTYDGKVKKPSVTAYIGSTRADASKYKVTYPTGMKNIGSYTVKVTGNQSKFCKGTLTATYRIDPKKVKTPSAKAGKKKVTVKWTKVSGGVKYQIAIAKKGGKYKTYAVSGNSKTVKKLTSKKKYTVKVRAYKKVGKKTYYGDWSKTKTVKVK